MEELMTVIRYTIAISTFVLSMLLMFRMGAERWAAMEPYEVQPDPEPRERRKPSPPPAKEQEAEEPDEEDRFTCKLTGMEKAAPEWSVNYPKP
jgi:hypothetical protein